MTPEPEAELTPAERVNDVERITRALRQAVREALWQHKIAGNPVVVWQNGRVEWIPPEEIPVDEDPRRAATKNGETLQTVLDEVPDEEEEDCDRQADKSQ